MNESLMYEEFIRPDWAPPSWIFGPVWTILYIIIFISFGVVFYKAFKGKISWSIALPFVLNLVFNFLFTPIQFGLKNNLLASIDVILVVITLVWGMIMIWKKSPKLRWVVYVNIPYLLWGAFATCLQLTITYLNNNW
jgi:benzodiazapine receptor